MQFPVSVDFWIFPAHQSIVSAVLLLPLSVTALKYTCLLLAIFTSSIVCRAVNVLATSFFVVSASKGWKSVNSKAVSHAFTLTHFRACDVYALGVSVNSVNTVTHTPQVPHPHAVVFGILPLKSCVS